MNEEASTLVVDGLGIDDLVARMCRKVARGHSVVFVCTDDRESGGLEATGRFVAPRAWFHALRDALNEALHGGARRSAKL